MTRIRLLSCWLPGIFCAALVFVPVSAPGQGKGKPPSLDALTRNAAVIVEGEVTGAISAWNAAHTQIHTTFTMEVTRYHKGGRGESSFEFRMLGGSVGEITLFVTHQPRIELDKPVLLFLNPQLELGEFPFVGGAAGKFDIEFDPASGREVLVRDAERLDKGAAERQIKRINRRQP